MDQDWFTTEGLVDELSCTEEPITLCLTDLAVRSNAKELVLEEMDALESYLPAAAAALKLFIHLIVVIRCSFLATGSLAV